MLCHSMVRKENVCVCWSHVFLCLCVSLLLYLTDDWYLDNSYPTLLLSDTIKTLDFSLPSYDKIANSKASVANVDGLAVEPLEPDDPKPVKVVKEKKAVSNDGETSSNVMTTFLPSMSKKGPLVAAMTTTKAPKEKKVNAPPRKTAAEAIEEKKQEKITIVDMSLPSYQDSTATKEKCAFAF